MHEKSTRINGEESSSWTRNGITVLGSSGVTGLGELSQNIFAVFHNMQTSHRTN